MLSRRRLLSGAAALSAYTAMPKQASATNTNAVKFGVIRWDAWAGQTATPPPAANTGWYAAHNLDPAIYHSRAPFFAQQIGANYLNIDGGTQAIMDQEITYAINAFNGRHFWCFGWTVNSDPYSIPFQLFQSSSLKSGLNYCLRFGPNSNFYAAVTAGTLTQYFQQSNYQTVLSGRPLIIYSVNALVSAADPLTAATTSIRNACTGAGLANPYIVVMDLSANMVQAATSATNIGADAVTTYAAPSGTLSNATYASLDTIVQAYWTTQKAAGASMLPIAMSGWNRAPRVWHPVPWESPARPMQGMTNVAVAATTTELASHVQSCINFVGANASACPANVAMLYAWNEFDEGGYICPTWTAGGGDHSRLDALAAVW